LKFWGKQSSLAIDPMHALLTLCFIFAGITFTSLPNQAYGYDFRHPNGYDCHTKWITWPYCFPGFDGDDTAQKQINYAMGFLRNHIRRRDENCISCGEDP